MVNMRLYTLRISLFWEVGAQNNTVFVLDDVTSNSMAIWQYFPTFPVTCTHLTALIADVPHDALTASSVFGHGHEASRSRLNTQLAVGGLSGGWAAEQFTVDEYIQVLNRKCIGFFRDQHIQVILGQAKPIDLHIRNKTRFRLLSGTWMDLRTANSQQ